MDGNTKQQNNEEKEEGQLEEDKRAKRTKGKHDEEIEKLRNRISDLEDQLKRSVADYRNLENRNKEERLEFVKFANKSLLEALLPAFDTLLLADKYTEDQNLKVTVKHLLEVLKSAGIERIETVEKEYDPSTMEAVEVVEGEEGKVLEETQPGFILSGKVIRPARVKVGGKMESGSMNQES